MTKKLISWNKWDSPWKKNKESDEDEVDFDAKDSPTGKVLIGPMGIVPLHDKVLSEEVFNFWVGNTNFKITLDICNIISRSDGVESFEVISPYRMRIAVAKLYKPTNVFNDIGQAVNNYFTQKEKAQHIERAANKKSTIYDLLSQETLDKVPWLTISKENKHA